MKTTLEKIQTLAKIAKVFCKVIYICCIIGAVGSLVGILSLALIPESIKVGGVTIHSMIEKEAEVSMGTVYTSMAVAMIMCLGELILVRFAKQYFEEELEAGTPFTFDGAKAMLRLGIKTIYIPIVTIVVASIAHGIMSYFFENVGEIKYSNFSSIALGIAFVIGSLFCKYGAELKQEKQDIIEEIEKSE